MQSLPRTARQIRVMALDFSRMNLMHSQKKKKKNLKNLGENKIRMQSNSHHLMKQLRETSQPTQKAETK